MKNLFPPWLIAIRLLNLPFIALGFLWSMLVATGFKIGSDLADDVVKSAVVRQRERNRILRERRSRRQRQHATAGLPRGPKERGKITS